MKPAPLLLFLPLLFPVTVLAARPLAKPELRADGRYEFRDQGGTGKFRIATDELQESGPGVSKRVTVTAQNHLRKIQDTAKQMSGGDRKLDLIAYKEDRPQTEANRRVVTEKVAVTLVEGIDPTEIGLAAGAIGMREVIHAPRDYVMSFNDAAEALTAAEGLKSVPGVLRSSVLLAQKMFPTFIPNDPLFSRIDAFAPPYTYSTAIGQDYAEEKTRMNPIFVIAFQPQSRAYQWYLNSIPAHLQIAPVDFVTYEDNQLPPFVDTDNTKSYSKYFDIQAEFDMTTAWDNTTANGSPIDGTNVRVGLVDDGVYLAHADLNAANFQINDDANLLDGVAKKDDPSVPVNGPGHGTAVAGLILARRDNTRGMTGVAPDAKLTAFRAIGGYVDPATFSDILAPGAARIPPRITATNPFGLPTGNEWRSGRVTVDISVNPWSYNPFGADLIGVDLYIRKALAYGVAEGRLAGGSPKGVVYVTPAGNEGEFHGDTNHFGMTNSMYTMTIGSITDLGRRAIYSNPGASLYAVAPSSGPEVAPRVMVGISTVIKPPFRTESIMPAIPAQPWQRALGYTLTPDEWDHLQSTPRNTQNIMTLAVPPTAGSTALYNSNFGGTSAACALASGVVALMLEANPNLGWRDVQEIIMRSAYVVDPMMGEWQYNPLGTPMSHKYGAGLILPDKAVRMAKVWQNLGERAGGQSTLLGSYDYKEYKGERNRIIQNTILPNNTSTSTTKQVVNTLVPPPSSGLRVEHVQVRMKVQHGRRGDLGIILSSPKSGQSDGPVESYLFVPHREDYNSNIGRIELEDNGTIEDGEYWEFMSVQHWGTSGQNQALDPTTVGGTSAPWTLTIWDNTSKGPVTSTTNPKADPNSLIVEDRTFVPVADPQNTGTGAAKIIYAEVIYHGTNVPANNQAPIIQNNGFLAQTGQMFQASVRALTDLSDTTPEATQRTPRAPITDYRIRVLGGLTPSAPTMQIAPTTAAEYFARYPTTTPNDAKPFLRFDRITGLLSNAPYPEDPT